MEEAQSAQSGKLLRYALRSGTKTNEEKPVSASKRDRGASNVSKSVSVLDLSGKDKPVKPPRRLSIPNKAAAATPPAPKLGGSITPISEARSRRSFKSETPASDSSRLTSRKKFNILSSESYWLSQIKLSEAAGKHSVSLGFFKLALEAGCEQPLQRLRDELKSYALRHKLGELAALAVPVKELFESYGVVDNEQLQVSETCSHVPAEGTRSSDEDAKSSTSSLGTRKLKPKSLNTDSAQVAKKGTPQKSIPVARTRASVTKKSSGPGPVSDSGTQRSTVKKPQKPIKQEARNEKDRKKHGNKSGAEQGAVSLASADEALNENKENEDAASMEQISLTEVA